MNSIHECAFKLHDKLLQSDEYIALKEAEKVMLEDKTCKNLLEDYYKSVENYNSNKSSSNQLKMHEAKLKLDENNLVISYKNAYKNYQILIGNITDLVFKDFSSSSLIDKIIRAN